MSRTHLVGISEDLKLKNRLEIIAQDFKFNFVHFDSTEKLSELEAATDAVAFVLSGVGNDDPADIQGQIQILKYDSLNSFIVLITNKKMTGDQITLLKKAGANLIINEEDVYKTSFLEYVLSQIIRGSMIPIKAHDLKSDTIVDFKVYTILPLNKKVAPVLHGGEDLKPAKLEKIKKSKELYVSRDDIPKMDAYLATHQDLSKDGILSRCRMNYLSLCKSHTDLIFSLFDRSDMVTFSQGKALLATCAKIASEMLVNLSTLADPWSIINNSTIGESGSAERSPAIAAMAGLMSINFDQIKTDDTILAGLIAEIGMITLPPELLRKIKDNQFDKLTPEEWTLYKGHPKQSIDKCLEKKLPLESKIKNIVIGTHEKFDGSGFSGQILPGQPSKESQLLQYCEFIDQKLMIKIGEPSLNSSEAQMKKLEQELTSKKILDIDLAIELKSYLSLVTENNQVS